MTDTILGYLVDYAPAILMLIMMFIDRFGFGNVFASFRKEITDAFDVKGLTSTINTLRDEIGSVLAENKELREELEEIREALQRVKGARK